MTERASSRRKAANDDEPLAKTRGGEERGPAPKFDKKTIALVYDFDGTLSPRPMQEYAFLPQIGADAAAFWAESNALARQHKADPLITYMRLMYKKAKANGIRLARVDEVISLVGLEGEADTRIGGFSLGMRQRLSVAHALLGDPGALVFDEPAAGA